jgi:hypothetical protein
MADPLDRFVVKGLDLFTQRRQTRPLVPDLPRGVRPSKEPCTRNSL